MTHSAAKTLGLRGCLALACLAASCTTAGDAGERVLLFDGVSLEGWEGDARYWRVSDGVLVGESTAENPCERTNYLVWNGGEVADFELTLEFRITGGNSGIQFRSRTTGAGGVAGFQADMDAGNQWTGGLYEQDGRGVLARHGERVVLRADGGKDVERFAPDAEFAFEEGAWHRYRITARGRDIELAVDGVTTTEVTDLTATAARAGKIALQLHQGPPMRVEYRNVRLEDLGRTTAEEAEVQAPQWIWPQADAGDNEAAWFRRDFDVREGLVLAELWATCDNRMELSLNGESVAESASWERPVRVDLLDSLRVGRNELFAWGRNDGGPAGLCVALELRYADGEEVVVRSDEQWLATRTDPGSDRSHARWEAAHSFGPLGVEPWGALGEGAEPEHEEALAGDSVTVPPGFVAERLVSVSRVRQGSWVSLTADDRGRLIASDQYGGLYRISPPAFGADETARVEALDVALGEAHGLLYAFDSLYVVVCGAGTYESGLYRARDTNGDDRFDRVEQLAAFEGDGEHGPHSVRVGPDGRSLYVVAGNHTLLPADVSRSLVPEVWGEDALLPRISDPGGHAVGKMAPGGWICRTDPEGREWELVAVGFRNPYDLDFDTDGELFTYDADMEWDIGLPWYRAPRICHVVSGAEFGWRHGSGKWPVGYPDSLPSVVDTGPASPTGVVFGTATAFPEKWRRAFFAADWSYGTIYAVHLEPKGSTYAGVAEPFVTGRPLPVTDVAVGGDGALYFTTGGRRTQSGLYRVRWIGDESGPTPAAAPAVLTGAPSPARLQRRAIEGFHGATRPDLAAFVWEALKSEDHFLRYAARTALEFQDPERWQERALTEADPRASVAALLALVRVGGGDDPARLQEQIVSWPWDDFDPETKLAALRVAGLTMIRLDPTREWRARLADVLAERCPTGEATVDPELCRVLVALQDPRVLDPALGLLEAATTQESRVEYAYALRDLRTGWDDARIERYRVQLDALLAAAAGGNSVRGYIERIREAAQENIGLEEPEAVAVEASVEPAEVVQHWTLPDLLPFLDEVQADRSYERGRDAYARASCVDCHRLGGIGKAEGPDLSGAGNRYTPRDLAEAIVSPSLVISDTYLDTEVWTTDERVHVGRLEDVSDESIVLRTGPPESARVEIPRADVVEERPSPVSRMPENLLDTLTREEILDLFAFVLAAGDPEAGSFRRGDAE